MDHRALDTSYLSDDPRKMTTVFEHMSEGNAHTIFDDFAEGRLNYFNSTNAVAWVTLGAVAVLLVAVMLYLYDFYATARSDTVPQYGPYGERVGYDSHYYNKR
jgi:hypothetical protein